MKKGFFLLCGFFLVVLASCGGAGRQQVLEGDDGSITITNIDNEDGAIKYNQKVDGFSGVTVVNGAKYTRRNWLELSLAQYADKDVLVEFSCDMKISNPAGESKIFWMINEPSATFPHVVKETLADGEWKTLSGTVFVHLTQNKSLYLSSPGMDKDAATFYLKNFKVKLAGDEIGSKKFEKKSWMELPSIKDAYSGIFDYTGFAVVYRNELEYEETQEGLRRHADCITLGNEFKPDFLFAWQKPKTFTDFTGEDGVSYKVPDSLPSFTTMDEILEVARDNGLKIRGHVLVWHSQTPMWFFHTDYNIAKPLVSVNEMNARMEWYIKTVLNHVSEWEAANNNGERLVTVWDVVNEACADGATATNWLRGAKDSKWFAVYKDETFIVNAFRYANKYAPKDVVLVYNDYGCYSAGKLAAICKVIDAVQAAPDARLDAIGMQSHVKIDAPAVTGNGSYEAAVQTFISKGLDVQVTELDIANAKNPYSPYLLRAKYKEYYEMFIRNRKTADKHGITGVTIWGLTDEGTWLNGQSEYEGYTQYPLLMDGNCMGKPAFIGVLEAAETL